MLSLSHTPRVSTATGTKMWDDDKAAYLVFFVVAAWEAAAPAVELVDGRWEAAKVSGTVASQARHFPLDQGIKEAPSGLKLVPDTKPRGSLTAATRALPKA